MAFREHHRDKSNIRDFPSFVVKSPCFQGRACKFDHYIRELRSHKPHSVATKGEREREREISFLGRGDNTEQRKSVSDYSRGSTLGKMCETGELAILLGFGGWKEQSFRNSQFCT